MSSLPCKNPECGSYGQPHPGCKCYAGLADGGDASFCSASRAHEKGCQYFQEGGDVIDPASVVIDAPEEIDPASVVIDKPEEIDPASVVIDKPDEIDPASVVIDKPKSSSTPDDHPEWGDKLSDQDIKKTMSDAENAASIQSFVIPGGGLMGAAAKVAEKAAAAAKLSGVGAAALKGAISSGLLQGADETSKAIMAHGDPQAAVSPYMATGAMTLFGGLLGGAGAKGAEVLTRAVEGPMMKYAAAAERFLAGIGHAASGGELEKGADKAFVNGFEAFRSLPEKVAQSAGAYMAGHGHGDLGLASSVLSKFVAPLLAAPINKVGKYTAPTIVRWLTDGAKAPLFNMIDYADRVAKGTSYINNSLDALFKGGSKAILNKAEDRDLDKLDKFIEKGGMADSVMNDAQGGSAEAGFAEGGDVSLKDHGVGIHGGKDHIAQSMPEQNLMIQAARGRASNYLSSLKPRKDIGQRLPFDDPPDDRQQTKKYRTALQVAVNPLSVLGHIKDGTMDTEHMQHLEALYPELSGHLKQKITERVTHDQTDGKKPSYAVRQGLSLFLGAPLSSEMTPQSIMAAQAVFAPKSTQPDSSQGSPQPAPRAKGSTAPLSKSDRSYLTDGQARERRQQKI